MAYKNIRYSSANKIIRITLDRPAKRNALSPEMLEELVEAFDAADQETDACCVVLRGAGDKAFCAGADLSNMSKDESFLDKHQSRALFPKLFNKILSHSKPTLAALNGHCIAGGLGLAMACDLVVARAGIKIGTPEIARGLFPFMVSALLLRSMGRRRANEMMLLGELMSAEEAEQVGLVTRTVAEDKFDDFVEAWAQKLASYSPAVLTLGRRALLEQEGMPLGSAFSHLQGLLTVNNMMDDAKEGIAAFFEKRPPVFKGR